MNPISAFFVRNIVVVFFLYGLAFFSMGLALVLAYRKTSEFKFAQAILPLAAFGVLHGIHEWIEMFQKIAVLVTGHSPTMGEEIIRLAVLVGSFLMLIAFGTTLLGTNAKSRWQRYRPLLSLIGLWAVGLLVVTLIVTPPPDEFIAQADVLARYTLGISGALLGTWALMAQQRTFRESGMPQFGRDLVWCAVALFLYGVVGQFFVRQTDLMPSTVINSTIFLQWFGIPVQLFRGAMAAILAYFMFRALKAFELENQRRLDAANRAKLEAQTAQLEAERKANRERERLYAELQLTAHELSLLLDLSNLLAGPMNLRDRLQNLLEKIIHSLGFPEAGIILLAQQQTETSQVQVSVGFSDECTTNHFASSRELGQKCIDTGLARCRHLDEQDIEFLLEEALAEQRCRHYDSPMVMIGLPLIIQQRVIGSIVLSRLKSEEKLLTFDELKLMVGIARQLGLSIENAHLYQEAQNREKLLGELLQQVVGAQESERQRIARELHDATGQSLTAISLGLRGVEATMEKGSPVDIKQIKELKIFGTNALGELRQLIADLRPPQLDDLGLVAALQWYIQSFEKRSAIQTDFMVTGERTRLPSEYETIIFRITQEALTNIIKHAHASTADVTLEMSPDEIKLTINDDGIGFESAQVLDNKGRRSGWGLLGIQERTLLLRGHYEIDTSPKKGTRVHVKIPLISEVKDVKDTNTTG
jgi:signal transduction histidine kinase